MTPAELAAMSPASLAAHCDNVLASRPVPLHLLAVVMGTMSGREAACYHDVDVEVPDAVDDMAALMTNDLALSQLRERHCRHRRRRGAA